MCAEFILKAKRKGLENALNESIESQTDGWDLHAKLYSVAPVIVADENKKLKIQDMSFSLKPPGTPYPTFNARMSGWDERKHKIVQISEKPTWRKPLSENRCLIPMTAFIEPVYLGEHAGHAVQFESPECPILFVAGIFEESLNEKTGELYEGFSLILHTPSDYILEMGHHRQVVILSPKDALRWIAPGNKKPEAASEFLLKHRLMPELVGKEARALSNNWEKKIPEYKTKLARERDYMKKLEEAM
jgi:putative SOS response-associated peptidase YedK